MALLAANKPRVLTLKTEGSMEFILRAWYLQSSALVNCSSISKKEQTSSKSWRSQCSKKTQYQNLSLSSWLWMASLHWWSSDEFHGQVTQKNWRKTRPWAAIAQKLQVSKLKHRQHAGYFIQKTNRRWPIAKAPLNLHVKKFRNAKYHHFSLNVVYLLSITVVLHLNHSWRKINVQRLEEIHSQALNHYIYFNTSIFLMLFKKRGKTHRKVQII